MDKNKKLSEELLKIDGIDPANISNAEREMFKTMLDKEMKHHKKLSWIITGSMWIFALAMFGLCMSERIFERLHIPFIVPAMILIAGVCAAIFLLLPRYSNHIQESGKKIQKLHFLVHNKHKGFPLVGKKNGKRYIDWISIILLAAALWLFMALGGAGVIYLISRRWIYSGTLPVTYIFFCTIGSLTFVSGLLCRGLKAPLEKLEEIKPENYTCSKRKFSFVTIGIIIILISIGRYFSGGSIDGSSVVWGRVLSDMDKFPTIIYTSVSEPISAHPTEVKSTSKTYNAGENGYRVDMFMGNELVLQNYELPKENSYYSIDHGKKEYFHIKLSDQSLPADIPRPKPQEMVKNILSENYTNIGKSKINGIIVEGVELKDKLVYGKDTVIKLWVDVKTNLPVKIEYESTFFDEGVQIYARLRSIDENFEWNVELDPATFEPNIPSDYKIEERFKNYQWF